MLSWLALVIGILCLFAIDLGLTRHRAARLTIVDAVLQTGFWISIGLAFGFYIYFTFEHNLFPAFRTETMSGREALTQYVNVFFLERVLSFDNLFVMMLTFQVLKIPTHLQYRVVFYGLILTALIRTAIVTMGVSLWENFAWMNYLLAALLIFGAIRLTAGLSGKQERRQSALARYMMRRLPTVNSTNDGKFFVRKDGKLRLTPLFICMIVVEYSDLIFATDSIPASLSVTENLLILISASLLSLLGMRALYFVFATALQQLRYIKVSLIVLVIFLSIKMLMHNIYPLDSSITLLVTASIVMIGVIYSLLHRDRGALPAYPILENFNRMYEMTYTGFRRIIITLIGVSVLIIGIIFIVTPGPAIIVIPAGLAILASEFVWARILLKKVKHKFVHYSKESKSFFERNKQNDKNDHNY
jgi:tellurite resistance protein TerC